MRVATTYELPKIEVTPEMDAWLRAEMKRRIDALIERGFVPMPLPKPTTYRLPPRRPIGVINWDACS